jgi:hypothetical protein
MKSNNSVRRLRFGHRGISNHRWPQSPVKAFCHIANGFINHIGKTKMIVKRRNIVEPLNKKLYIIVTSLFDG